MSPVNKAGSIESTSFPIKAGTDTPSIIVVIMRVMPILKDHLFANKMGKTRRNQFLDLSWSIFALGSSNLGFTLTGSRLASKLIMSLSSKDGFSMRNFP